jgi:DNA-binding transcriptional MerR regulator
MAAESSRGKGIAEKELFRIGEVSRITSTKPFVLRYWETEFPMLQPVKTPKGHRLYRREDIETVLEIKRLLYDEGFTIAGARRYLREHNGGAAQDSPRDPRDDSPSSIDRRVLRELRDELRAILTLLERG